MFQLQLARGSSSLGKTLMKTEELFAAYLYLLATIQILVYAFSVTNQSLFIFTPLLERFSPPLLTALQSFHLDNGPLLYKIRGTLGLIVSLSLAAFLTLLMKPAILEQAQERLHRISRLIIRKELQS